MILAMMLVFITIQATLLFRGWRAGRRGDSDTAVHLYMLSVLFMLPTVLLAFISK